ncbi:hypothetical protein GCK32_004239 [Trichostrongylus colubriformis]|uniref:Fragile site-associated protein C-terminal domain-containing protein n=1 Tax=Trichostrongylus colubriformis TaxID=6319 RepID=A0AAN8G7G6_TRICO
MNQSHDHIFDKVKFGLDDETIDPQKRSFWVFLSSLVLFVVWIVFLTYYLSRVVGPIVAFLLNRYLRFTKTPGHIKLTSFSLSLLGGKLMFKDFLFANDDYSLRINDGWIVFSYWNYVPGRKVNFKRFFFTILLCRRVVVGNRLLPYMLVVSMENMNSKVRLRESAADRALLSVEGQAESVRASFLKHPDYNGVPYKDPPRTMGDGFAILQSALLHFFYHQDILGYVTVDEQSLVTQRPVWESIWRFDHNTVISYGPWAEQQRVLLHSFFFPSDYQTIVADELPKRGKRRIHIMHDVRISLLKETSIDVWFMRGDQLESVHSRCQPGSTIDMSIWWITKENGFSWSMHTSLLRLESTSSLPYRKLLEAETFSIDAEFKYPRVFNAKQTWDLKFRLTKCCCWLVWDHQRFVADLITEFLGDTPADLVTFIPYTVSIDFDVSDSFEVILLLNESNWVDPSEKNPENVEASIVGRHCNISFTMSFEDFLPELVSTTYTLRLENSLALRLRYPPASATAPVMAALSRGAYTNMYSKPSSHGRVSKNTEEWHEIWRTESIICVIDYSYHPNVSKIASDIPVHVLQEFLPKPVEHPKDLPPDKMNVRLEIGGSEVMFTGSLIKCVIELKNNYFGLYDSPLTESLFTTAEPSPLLSVSVDLPRVHIAMFECSILPSEDNEVKTAANMAAVLIQKASVSSGTTKELTEGGVTITLNSSVLSAQFLHFTPRLVTDFAGNRVNFKASLDWEKSQLASRMLDIEPRVVVDFQVPDVEVSVERRESQLKPLTDSLTRDLPEKGAPPLTSLKALHMYKVKIEIGAVNTLIVMPRPLEMTGKNEFPLYDVLSPCLTTWLHVLKKVTDNVVELQENWGATVDMSFAQVLKLALDSTDDRIFDAKIARSVMLKNATSGGTKRGSSANDQKVDLYHWLLSVHREPKDRKSAEAGSKEYLNPMDIMPQAFFYSFYRSRRLEWTNLDELPVDQLSLVYVFIINNIVTAMVEQRVVSSAADTSRKFITPHLHQLIHVKKVTVDGKLSWHIVMDEKGLLPERGIADIRYNGNVENVRFVVALCSVCLIKEIALVSKTLATPSDLKKRVSTAYPFVIKKVRGELEIDSVRLESILTDLYVSVMVQQIGIKQHHDSDHSGNKSKKNVKSVTPSNNATMFDISLRKASLALMESDSAKQNMHIVNCTLHESSARLSSGVADGDNQEPLTTLRVTLGAIEGELPVAAHSLHDVVMRHGPQLEQQFNRLSAQPTQPTPSNPLPVQVQSPLQEVPVAEPTQVAGSWQQDQVKPMDSKKPVRPRAPVMKIKFDFETSNIELRARLLPSLLARYRLNRAYSSGVTGDEAKWTASIQTHCAEFCVSSAGKPMDTFTLALPAVAVNGEYTVDKEGTAPATNKALLYREGGYLKVTVTLGQVNHSFTTDLLNQILFAEQSFRSELSALITRLRAERHGWSPGVVHAPQSANKEPLLLFSLAVKGQGVPWLQLTAATPTATAVRFTIESIDAELTNRWVLKELGSAKERLFGAAAIQLNAKLGQLVKVAEYEELQAELQEYATFMTQIRVENKESSSHQSYSYHIALNRPILLIKSSAIDKAVLLWLNYKNTYDYWRAERSKVVRAATAAGKQRSNSIQHAMFSPPQSSQDFDINLSLAINNGMYVCMPLYSQDLTDGMPALVLSLQKSDVTVCIMKELACQASFHGFKMNFIDNFDEMSLSESVKEATGNTQTNYLFFPQGTYQLCSQASTDAVGAKWVLSVRSQMRGMVIDLDQRIGKFAKMVVNTFSSLGENEDDMDDRRSNISEDDDPKIEGAGELKKLRPEERVPWMERKMHEQSTLVSDLVACKASEKRVEAERSKLRQYELMRFKEFRRSMIEKIRRRKNTGNKGERRPRVR